MTVRAIWALVCARRWGWPAAGRSGRPRELRRAWSVAQRITLVEIKAPGDDAARGRRRGAAIVAARATRTAMVDGVSIRRAERLGRGSARPESVARRGAKYLARRARGAAVAGRPVSLSERRCGRQPEPRAGAGYSGPAAETFIENIFVAEVQTSYTFDFFGAALLADRALARQVQEQALQFESTRQALDQCRRPRSMPHHCKNRSMR